ncbi:MaoC family dehydratase [Pigmentiphaga soli]|uniref:MaoC family dehydratase n=1 Tax=Pigmentiphaga soli TaxID=1007095 RepID=A0ABP8H034_9BURK
MIEVDTHQDLRPYVGRKLGTSGWLTVDQARIDAFAAVSGDHNWIHVDVERAQKEMPGGKTIAHGMLTLSLLAWLGAGTYRVRRRTRAINYGSNKVRFTAPVPSGSRIRLHRSLLAYDPVEGGARLTFDNRVEIEGVERPALYAETISIVYSGEEQ